MSNDDGQIQGHGEPSKQDGYLAPGTPVVLGVHGRSTSEYGVVVHCWFDSEFGFHDCYVAFFGEHLPNGRPSEKPYILRYASTSLIATDLP